MQISCTEKHLGAFLSPFSSFSTPHLLFHLFSSYAKFRSLLSSFHMSSSPLLSFPLLSCSPILSHFCDFHFLPSPASVFILLSPLLLPSPCIHSPLVSLQQRSRFLSSCFLSASLSLSVRAVFYSLFSFHSNDDEEIYMKSFSVALLSGGGFNWRLYIQIGLNIFSASAAAQKNDCVGAPAPMFVKIASCTSFC